MTILEKLRPTGRWKWVYLAVALFFLWYLLRGCGSNGAVEKSYLIGRDISWYGFDLRGKEPNMVAFTDDLLAAISKAASIQLYPIDVSTESLFFGLNNGQWDGVMSSLAPDALNMQQYLFSEPFYITGPVLVVAADSKIATFDDLNGKLVAIPKDTRLPPAIAQQSAVFTPYGWMGRAIVDLLDDRIDAVIMNFTSAKVYEQSIYAGKIKIVAGPILSKALRLIVRKDTPSAALIEKFDAAMRELIQNSNYQNMLIKWNLVI